MNRCRGEDSIVYEEGTPRIGIRDNDPTGSGEMPILVEPFVEGLMKDEALAAIAHQGISLYYNEMFCYLHSIQHIEALFRRFPALKMEKDELCGESMEFEYMVSSWEE